MMLRTALAMTLAFLAIPALADESGTYIGFSTGQMNVRDRDELSGFQIDSDDNAVKGILGWRKKFLAFELNYVDFGQAKQRLFGQQVELDAHGIDAFVILSKRIALLDLYAKAGALLWEAEASVQGLGSLKSDGSDFAFGGGAQLIFGALAIRAEYEQFMIKDIDDLNLVSVGLTWQF
jgi:OmpA-like transmembrane domain